MNKSWDYGDVVNLGFILPQKTKYTMRDWKKVVPELAKMGYDHVCNRARWIIMCSTIFHGVECSAVFYDTVRFQMMDMGF